MRDVERLPTAERPLVGTIAVPGDKSMSHRALLLAAVAKGRSRLGGISPAADVAATQSCLAALGIAIECTGPAERLVVGGEKVLAAASEVLDCGNAGTAMRLLTGLLVATNTPATVTGDTSLSRRPMGQLVKQLQRLGAAVAASPGADGGKDRPPLFVGRCSSLTAGDIELPVPSAQLASALLLAALGATGTLRLHGLAGARDHTERLLAAMGVVLERTDDAVTMVGGQQPAAIDWNVPGDPSSAAFWLAAAAIVPGSRVVIADVSLNATRLGFVRLLARMGAGITIGPLQSAGHEPRGTIELEARPLVGASVEGSEVPGIIDELPLLAGVASYAKGLTCVRGATQLRFKESDRIAAMAAGLHAMGAGIKPLPDGFVVEGATPLRGARVDSFGDHRIAMSLAVAHLGARGPGTSAGAAWTDTSYPGFWQAWRGALSSAPRPVASPLVEGDARCHCDG